MWLHRITKLPDESLSELTTALPCIIIAAILKETGFTLAQLKVKSRKNDMAITRHMMHYFLSIIPGLSFREISLLFSKNHATVINSVKQIENLIYSNREFRLRMIRISQSIILQTNTFKNGEEKSTVNR